VPPGHVDAAGLVRDPVLRDPLVGRARVTPVTAVPGTAGHQNLSQKSQLYTVVPYTVKKVINFPVPSGDVTYQTLPGRLVILVSDIPARGGKTLNLFYSACRNCLVTRGGGGLLSPHTYGMKDQKPNSSNSALLTSMLMLILLLPFLLLQMFMLSSLLLLVVGVPSVACVTAIAGILAVPGVF
jgi:hypothetical protein